MSQTACPNRQAPRDKLGWSRRATDRPTARLRYWLACVVLNFWLAPAALGGRPADAVATDGERAGGPPPIAQAAQAETAPNWAGEYRGEYSLGRETTYISARFAAATGGISGTLIAPLEDGAERQPAAALSLDGNRIRFQIQRPGGVTTFEGELENDSIKGKVARKSSSGHFELIHLARISPNAFANYLGDYKTASGRFIVVGRSLASLYYFDELSGRTGPLLATSETDFFGGPSSAVAYPIDARVKFHKENDGSISALTFSLGGADAVAAAKTQPYTSEEVAFQNGNVRLSGSLAIPAMAGPHPAVVMLAGSNAQSRYGQDGILAFNADFLARLGFAVLSYDKRGTGSSTGEREDIGLDGDALAGVDLLRQRKDIDPRRIGLWGLSQGGMIAPQVAAQTAIAFIISVSGDVVRGDQQEIERVELQLRADGFAENEIREAVAFQRLKFAYAYSGRGWEEYAAAYARYKDRKWFPDPYIGAPASRDDPGFEFWRKGAGSVSPAEYWEKYKNPALIVFGQFETYSKPSSDIARFKEAMKKAGNSSYTIAIIPKAEHTMREAKTGGPRERPYLNRFVAGYFGTLREWLRQNVPAN